MMAENSSQSFVMSNSSGNLDEKQFKTLEQKSKNDGRQYLKEGLTKNKDSTLNQLYPKINLRQQKNAYQQNTKVYDNNTIDISNSYLILQKQRLQPYKSISPFLQRKKFSPSLVNNEVTQLSKICMRNSTTTQTTCQSVNKSPSFIGRKWDSNTGSSFTQTYQANKEIIKTKEQNLPNKKLTSLFLLENKLDNKENEQLLKFSLNLDKNTSRCNDPDKSTIINPISHQDSKQMISSSTLATISNNPLILNTSLSQQRNTHIKFNKFNPYSTKELLIPLHNIDSLQSGQLNFKDQSKVDEKPRNKNNFSFKRHEKDQKAETSQLAMNGTKEEINKQSCTEESNRNHLFSKRELNIVNGKQNSNNINKTNVEQLGIVDDKQKKISQILSQSKTPNVNCFIRQRSLTIQNQQNGSVTTTNNLDRQNSLPRLKQQYQNFTSVSDSNNISINRQVKLPKKGLSKRTSIKKRLEDLMQYNVVEEFKKRFQGIFKEKPIEKPSHPIMKKSETKKRVHFVFEDHDLFHPE